MATSTAKLLTKITAPSSPIFGDSGNKLGTVAKLGLNKLTKFGLIIMAHSLDLTLILARHSRIHSNSLARSGYGPYPQVEWPWQKTSSPWLHQPSIMTSPIINHDTKPTQCIICILYYTTRSFEYCRPVGLSIRMADLEENIDNIDQKSRKNWKYRAQFNHLKNWQYRAQVNHFGTRSHHFGTWSHRLWTRSHRLYS